jgi:hypothetical protein
MSIRQSSCLPPKTGLAGERGLEGRKISDCEFRIADLKESKQ